MISKLQDPMTVLTNALNIWLKTAHTSTFSTIQLLNHELISTRNHEQAGNSSSRQCQNGSK